VENCYKKFTSKHIDIATSNFHIMGIIEYVTIISMKA